MTLDPAHGYWYERNYFATSWRGGGSIKATGWTQIFHVFLFLINTDLSSMWRSVVFCATYRNCKPSFILWIIFIRIISPLPVIWLVFPWPHSDLIIKSKQTWCSFVFTQVSLTAESFLTTHCFPVHFQILSSRKSTTVWAAAVKTWATMRWRPGAWTYACAAPNTRTEEVQDAALRAVCARSCVCMCACEGVCMCVADPVCTFLCNTFC